MSTSSKTIPSVGVSEKKVIDIISKVTHLKRNNSNGGEKSPSHRQGVLPSEKTRVKVTNTWNHDRDEGHGDAEAVDSLSAFGGVGNRAASRAGGVKRMVI